MIHSKKKAVVAPVRLTRSQLAAKQYRDQLKDARTSDLHRELASAVVSIDLIEAKQRELQDELRRLKATRTLHDIRHQVLIGILDQRR